MSESGDWSAQAADTIESVVGSIRDKTTVPLTTVARALVYGIVTGVAGGAALLLLAIALVRILDVYTPGNVWKVYAFVGGLFTVGGLFAWSKRTPKDRD